MSSASAAVRYRKSGLAPIPIPARSKGPNLPNWQNLRMELEDVPKYFKNGRQNIGILLGEPSGGLIDVDLDTPEAVAAGRYLLPDTLRSGRESSPNSHYWYKCDPIPETAKFQMPRSGEGPEMFVELRSTGKQTVVAPSVHPDGDQYTWGAGETAEISGPELLERVREVATAALLARHWPTRGRHEITLAAAGYLGRRLDPERVEAILEAAAAAAGDEEERDRRRAVQDTLEGLQAGRPMTGGPALDQLAPGVPEILTKWWGWRREPASIFHNPGEEDAPKIQVNGRHLREVSADTLDALQLANNPPEIFVRSGALVRVREDEHGTPQIQNMDLNHLRGRADRCADFLRVTKRDEKWIETKVNPPEVVMKDVMALSSWPFPALEAVVEAPILRPDGTIFDTPGYDERTRLYYRPAGDFEFPDIPRDPGKQDISKALELVNEAIGEFPYADKASAANTLGLMLTPLVRQAIKGPVPLALIDKPQAGTGGSLLAETVSVIGSGRTAEMLGAPKDDEEWRKQITAKLSAGGTMVTVDNVEGALYAPSLARALTARTWTDRILGRSETVTVSQRATWVATGNNIVLRGDLPRRCYWIRLDAKDSRPWQRENFKHSDLLSWVSNNRGRLVHALLTIARAWFVAGKPKAVNLPRLGSFETWTEIVGGMVTFAGIPGFLDNLSELYDKADEGGAEWEAFLSEWWRQRGEDSITVKDLTALLEDEKQFREALPGDLLEAWDKSKGSFTRRLGNALSKRAGTRYGDEGLHVSTAGEFRRAKLWSVQEGSEECEFVSFVSLYNPSASKNREEKQGTSHKVAGEEPENNSTNSQTHTDGEWEKSY